MLPSLHQLERASEGLQGIGKPSRHQILGEKVVPVLPAEDSSKISRLQVPKSPRSTMGPPQGSCYEFSPFSRNPTRMARLEPH